MPAKLVQPGAWHWVDAHQAGPAWSLALCSGLDQPGEHPASLAGSSCAHTGSHLCQLVPPSHGRGKLPPDTVIFF